MVPGHGGACEDPRREPEGAGGRARRRFERGGLFRAAGSWGDERSGIGNHLTPEELSKETGLDRAEVIRICLEEHVPIYQGKIDKTLFQAQLEAIKAGSPNH
jgi:hypothetical protein